MWDLWPVELTQPVMGTRLGFFCSCRIDFKRSWSISEVQELLQVKKHKRSDATEALILCDMSEFVRPNIPPTLLIITNENAVAERHSP